jgi:polyhydroxybutyrate depolymerase
VLHVAGEKDAVVPFANQQRTMAAVRKLNGCDETGTAWAKGCTQYASKAGPPVVTFIHPGDHKYPEEAPALIVKFFREHARPRAE